MSFQGSCLCHSTFNVSHYSESKTQQAGGSAQDAAFTEVREEDATKACSAVKTHKSVYLCKLTTASLGGK